VVQPACHVTGMIRSASSVHAALREREKQRRARAMTKVSLRYIDCIKIKGAEARGASRTPHPPPRHLTIEKT